MSNPPASTSTGSQLTALVIYENVRVLSQTSRHLIFDCQLFGLMSRSLDTPLIVSLRYFNGDRLSFNNDVGAMVVRADITQCDRDAILELTNNDAGDDDSDRLVQSDFYLVGDIKWVLPLKSIQESFDLEQVHPPMISANGIVLSKTDELHDSTLDPTGPVAIFTMEPTQYTSYYGRDTDPRKLTIKAFFRLKSKRYEHGAPLPWPGRIVHVDGRLHDVLRDSDSGRTTCIIAVEDIDSLASGILPHSARAGVQAHGSRKRKFAFDPSASRSIPGPSTLPPDSTGADPTGSASTSAQLSAADDLSPLSSSSPLASDSMEMTGDALAPIQSSEPVAAPPPAKRYHASHGGKGR
ncbi:hypothetical protein L226DRAFT_610563 [Lentinus tigrinus ALCF2SS1-7]|uniref:Uncharacterized protein n=1 Tax=Lentinus tigrinus ALCF2SS1-6 TaxID=1328759 RepID=A0A5C2S234_9APHY|nr:hypothetical protein L227DRAFT_530096 [Lentinus tigrinus ALCF2SS1-6]RPD78703.1 hypothetical protein L226DRAFT_610563 [Lentinus tigrinus ALCF2SS1-7]